MSTSESVTNNEIQKPEEFELTPKELALVHWEELALSLEEHYHALDLWQKRPNAPPMGHR